MRILISIFVILAASSCATPKHEEWIASGITIEELCGYMRMESRLESEGAMHRRRGYAKDAFDAMGVERSVCEPFFNKAVAAKFVNSSDSSLCRRHMSYRRNSSKQDDIRREMRRRNLDCWEYGDVEQAHRDLDEIAAQKAAERRAKRRQAYSNLACAFGGGCQQRSASTQSKVKPRQTEASKPSAPKNTYLVKTEGIIGGSLCHYSDGSVIRVKGGYCPR